MDYNDHFNLLLAMTLKLRVIIDPNENTIFFSMIKTPDATASLRIYSLKAYADR